MGRDFTPHEMHFADKTYGIAKMPIRLSMPDGGQQTVWDPASPFAAKYPNTAFLFSEQLCDGLPEPVLDSLEQCIAAIIREDDDGTPAVHPNRELLDMVRRWYHGELDPAFYYREYNSGVLAAYLARMPEKPDK